MICSCSGAEASALSPVEPTIEAWARWVNAHGGINGSPVQLIVKDDGLNPAVSLEEAKELVTQDHIMAMVGEMSEVDSTWASYIKSTGVPVIGGISQEPPFLSNPDFFPSGAQISQVVGIAGLAKRSGKRHIGVYYCAEAPICAQVVPVEKLAAKLYGLGFTTGKISATAPSYAAPCLTAKRAGVDAMWVADASPVVLRFAAACVQQGYDVEQVGEIPATTNAWLSDPNERGVVLTAPNANPYDPSTPAIRTFREALARYAPGLLGSSGFGYDSILTWSGGLLFQAAAEAAHLTANSTSADVKKGLYDLRDETLGGISPPLTFAQGGPRFVPCYFTDEITDGRFLSLNQSQPTCLTASQAREVAALVH
jgi:branched-chain amino acid transport system substrate-binding protein